MRQLTKSPCLREELMSDETPEESSHGGDVSGVVEDQQGSTVVGVASLR